MAWWRRFPEPESLDLRRLVLQFYTRQGCHLCDDALTLLRELQLRHGFSIEVIDIDADAQLKARFDECVPVIELEGKVRFRGLVNRTLLERLFQAEAARR